MKSIGGLLLVTILVLIGVSAMSCKGKSNPTAPGGGADEVIQISGNMGSNSFVPNPDTVVAGAKVQWHNSDAITHTATSNTVGVFDTGNVGGGADSKIIQMNTKGTFQYKCTIHTTMTGTLVVL